MPADPMSWVGTGWELQAGVRQQRPGLGCSGGVQGGEAEILWKKKHRRKGVCGGVADGFWELPPGSRELAMK